MSKRQNLNVANTWGEGPDVLVTHTYQGFDGCHHFRYIDLTIDEARALAAQLLTRAWEAEKAVREAQEYFDNIYGDVPGFSDIAGPEYE